MPETLPSLRLLLALHAVAREGDITRAAARLNVTQPALSQSVRTLEAALGVAVLDRSRRPAALTPAGRLLAEAVRDGLGRIAEAVAEIRAAEERGGRSAAVSCTVGFATHWLMPRLAEFYRAEPGIAVSVLSTHEESPPLGPEIDLAIRFGAGRWSDGAAELLFPERVRPVCSPAFAALAGGRPLGALPLIAVATENESWIGWGAFFRRLKLGAAPAGALRFGNYVQAVQAALDDRGVMLGWRSITGDLEAAGRLVAPFAVELVPDDRYHLVTPNRRPPSPAAEAVRTWLLGQLAG